MKCEMIIKRIIEAEGDESFPLLERLALNLHLLFCDECAESFRRYQESRDLLARMALQSALPPALPDLNASIMAKLFREEGEFFDESLEEMRVPFPRWVVTGCIIVVSLVSAFFGFDFKHLSAIIGPDFILSMGITIGLVISAYSALFIGSHLKELSERFKLH